MIILFDEDETIRYNSSEMFGKWSMYDIPIKERHIETTANRFFNKRELVNATFIASNWTHPYNKEGMEKWMQGKYVAVTLFDNVIKITALTTKIGKNNDFGIKLRTGKQKEYLSES